MDRTFFCMGLMLVIIVLFRFFIESFINPAFEKRERITLEYKAFVSFFYFGFSLAFALLNLWLEDDSKRLEVLLVLSSVGFGWYFSQILCMYGGQAIIFRPFYWLRGVCFASIGATVPYKILYKNGTKSNKVLFKRKKGILWEYEGREYLVSLYDAHYTAYKSPSIKESFFLAAIKDKELQKTLKMAGGRAIVNGRYYCSGSPSIVESGGIGMHINGRGEAIDWYQYCEQLPYAMVRSIR